MIQEIAKKVKQNPGSELPSKGDLLVDEMFATHGRRLSCDYGWSTCLDDARYCCNGYSLCCSAKSYCYSCSSDDDDDGSSDVMLYVGLSVGSAVLSIIVIVVCKLKKGQARAVMDSSNRVLESIT